MKQIFNLLLLILLSCSAKNNNTIDSIKQDPKEIDAIKKILISQQKFWNNGDLDGFMQGYWNSEELIFTSQNHKPAFGWKNTLKRYKNSYPNKESMGELRFDILDLKLLTKTTASISGTWELIREKDHPNGLFWLDINKFEKNWLIIKDSTISFEINTTL